MKPIKTREFSDYFDEAITRIELLKMVGLPEKELTKEPEYVIEYPLYF